MNQDDKRLAYLLFRMAMGLNIFVHGAGRLGENYVKFIDNVDTQFASTILPGWSVDAFAHLLPLLETAIGIVLLIGIATRVVSVAGAVVMMFLILGSSILQDWGVVGLQMNYVLFYALLIVFLEWNQYSMDGALTKRRQKMAAIENAVL